MLYPAISLTSAQAFLVERRIENGLRNVEPDVEERTCGESAERAVDFLRVGLELFNATFNQRLSSVSARNRDQLEGQLSPVLYTALIGLPAGVLSDRDFWRYLALCEMFDFVVWRDGDDGALPANGSFGASGSRLHTDTVPMRMFNRGSLALRYASQLGLEPNFELAEFSGSEMWKSHIWRTLNWQAPLLVGAIFEADKRDDFKVQKYQLRADKSQELLREFVKRLKKQRSNLIFESLSSEDCEQLVSEQLNQSIQFVQRRQALEDTQAGR
jgi:hypothetical protein